MMTAETLHATLPDLAPESRLVALTAPDSPAAEQYRVLLQRLLRLSAHRPMRVIAVTSAGRGEGRTTTAANLALTAVLEGRSAVLVEADLRHPALGIRLGLAPRAGLAEVLAGRADLGQALARLGPLPILLAGEGREEGALLRSPAAAALLAELRSAYELVILDAPPAVALADGDRLAGEADGAILVVRAGTTPRQVVRLAADSLGERLIGIALNDVDPETVAHGRWIYPGHPGAARVG